MHPGELAYTKEHEWAKIDNGLITFGITHYAQEQLGDVVFVELPKIGSLLVQGATCGVIESVKAVSELYSPVSGTVTEVNSEILDHPELINNDPYGKGWLLKVEVSGDPLQGLLPAVDYRKLIGEE